MDTGSNQRDMCICFVWMATDFGFIKKTARAISCLMYFQIG